MPTIIPVTDLQLPELLPFTQLSEKQLYHYYEPSPGIFLAESPNVIERALDAGFTPLSLLTFPKMWEGLSDSLKEKLTHIPIYLAAEQLLASVSGFQVTRGIQCAMLRKALPDIETVCRNAERIVVLENVMNPTNVGAIFRSAAALHIDALLLTDGCSDPLQKRSLRVSVGNVFQIPWTYFPKAFGTGQSSVSEGSAYINGLKALGFTTVAMALKKDSLSLSDPILKEAKKLAIIMGTEGEGLADSTIAACDYTVMIPMSNNVDSLNVAAASAVAFWELTKKS